GQISCLNLPESIAAIARWGERREKLSCFSRVICGRSFAIFSAVSPIESVPYFSLMIGFGYRQPNAVSQAVRLPNENPASAFGIEYGARLMDSTPPAIYTSPSPALIARRA